MVWALGIGSLSLTVALDLTTPGGRAMAALMAVFGAFEREILGQRVRAPGRTASGWADPQLQHCTRIESGSYIGSCLSRSEIARRLNIGRTSVRRILIAEPPRKK